MRLLACTRNKGREINADNNRGLQREFHGDVDFLKLCEATVNLQATPQFNNLEYLIKNHSKTTNSPFKLSEQSNFNKFVKMRAQTKKLLKVAIVIRNTEASSDSADSFKELMKSCFYNCEIFTCLHEAKEWVAAN
ncbi:MAG: hypothetical protein R8K49_00095 [Mariprofundaceae bacterium]